MADGSGPSLSSVFTGGFRVLVTILLGLLAWLGNQVYTKVDAAADKSTVQRASDDLKMTFDKSSTALWEAIQKAAAAQNQLATSLSVLQAQFIASEAEIKSDEQLTKDHEGRIRLLEARPTSH